MLVLLYHAMLGLFVVFERKEGGVYISFFDQLVAKRQNGANGSARTYIIALEYHWSD